MKKVILLFFTLLIALSVISCADMTGNNNIKRDTLSVAEDTETPASTIPDIAENEDQTSLEEAEEGDEFTPDIGGGSDGVCPVHDQGTFHSISGVLIDKVGQDRFDSWLASLPEDYNENGCNSACNIVRFLKDFNLTAKEIEEYIYGPDYYILAGDTDALLNGDLVKYEESLRTENYDDRKEDSLSSEWAIKISLLDYLRDSGVDELAAAYNDITENGQNYNISSWSIAELVYKTGIGQDILQKAWHEQQFNEFLNCPVETFDYDFGIIYEGDGLRKEIEELYPVQVDELLRK